MRVPKFFRNESGFWSAISILVLTSLAALGFSTYTTLRNEGSNAANQMQLLKADFAATSGAYMGLALYEDSTDFQPKTLTVSGVNVNIQVDTLTGGGALLTSSAVYQNQKSAVQIIINPPPPPPYDYEDYSMFTTGSISNVTPQDSAHNTDWNRLKQNADSIPTIRINDLIALSNSQGHTKIGNWDAPDNWCGSFWRVDGDPNVTYVQGNMTVQGSRTVYGIFIVTGSITLNGNCNVVGVLYLPNQTSSIFHGAGGQDDSVMGGVISHGNISGTGNHVNVANKKSYMKAFYKYKQFSGGLASDTPIMQRVMSWKSVVSQ